MYAAIRFLASMLALLVGWATGVVALLGAIWGVWLFLSGISFLAHVFGPPPPFVPLAMVAMALPILLLGFSLVVFVCLPARWVMPVFVSRGHVHRAPDASDVTAECRVLAERMNLRTPAVYAYSSDALNAWAVSTLVGSAVVVSTGLLTTLTPVQRQWVLAHELAHIKYFDSGAAAFWASAMRVVSLGWTIHHGLVNGTARVLDALRLPFVVWAIMAAPLFVVSYALIAADAVARGLFLGIDRWVGRAMEYRADRVAATVVGAAPGIAVLSKLYAGIEPSFGLFATHPATKRRLQRLQRRFSADAAAGSPDAPPAVAPHEPGRTSPQAATSASGASRPSAGGDPAATRPPAPESANAPRAGTTLPSRWSRT